MPIQMQGRTKVGTALLTGSLLLTLVGCAKTQPVAQISARPTNLNSHGIQKLTPQQVDEKIRAVEANTTLPESAKPNIIASIRDQGQP